jgi:hypothetical protein
MKRMHKTITRITMKMMREDFNNSRASRKTKNTGTPKMRKVRRDVSKILKKIPKEF